MIYLPLGIFLLLPVDLFNQRILALQYSILFLLQCNLFLCLFMFCLFQFSKQLVLYFSDTLISFNSCFADRNPVLIIFQPVQHGVQYLCVFLQYQLHCLVMSFPAKCFLQILQFLFLCTIFLSGNFDIIRQFFDQLLHLKHIGSVLCNPVIPLLFLNLRFRFGMPCIFQFQIRFFHIRICQIQQFYINQLQLILTVFSFLFFFRPFFCQVPDFLFFFIIFLLQLLYGFITFQICRSFSGKHIPVVT